MVSAKLVFNLLAVSFILFNIATDWNVYRTLVEDVQKYRKVEPVTSRPTCSCLCVNTTHCTTPLSSDPLCDSLQFADTPGVGDVCLAYETVHVNKQGDTCNYTWDYGRFDHLHDELNETRWASLVLNCILLPFTIFYIIHLLRQIMHEPTAEEDLEMTHATDQATSQGVISVQPSSSSTDGTVVTSIETQPTTQKRKGALSSVNRRFDPETGHRVETMADHRNKGMIASNAFRKFIRVLHLRVIFLILEDLPQLFILMRYAILVYNDDGLRCSACVGDGRECFARSGGSNQAIVISVSDICDCCQCCDKTDGDACCGCDCCDCC
ncbi:uncharacterized protein MONBRDRAFT_6734 [Monosiga brevicollis MX1]|uniref:Uncharacterized protein n=1 Tax=Monosiga brevicollis TaxID=81824 RepID=A9UV54_MONBE|nr:uncharacterized protein MONBRDRAFT_6734 [Monosiga brevicollis MX1]EDQ91022.1 predicted protein [Monosiga brevicollis MX1]|eukprot:XP_001744319.1 hypothetical protein [Monosiga brevicollis MX1]